MYTIDYSDDHCQLIGDERGEFLSRKMREQDDERAECARLIANAYSDGWHYGSKKKDAVPVDGRFLTALWNG